MMNLNKNKSIGIWGYGIVGKAAITYFLNKQYTVGLMEKRELTHKEVIQLKEINVQVYTEENREHFFNSYDFLFSSPGVNIVDHYTTYKHKWIHELDIFYQNFQKPIIAITGSVGKTSCTHIFASLLTTLNIPIIIGGNIGPASLALLNNLSSNPSFALLEVSSFQLEYCKNFSPYLAIWTNFYANHLDHHATEQNYFLAKQNMLIQQKSNSYSLIPLSLQSLVIQPTVGHERSYFTLHKPTTKQILSLAANERIYGMQDDMLYRYTTNTITPIVSINKTSAISFIENIVIISAACDILNLDSSFIHSSQHRIKLLAHRLEHIGTYNNINFYNDSKATTTASTLAAVTQLQKQPLHLFIGGLSKGVNRMPFIAQLKNMVHHIYCFGAEADELYTFCIANNIAASSFLSLDSAVNNCINQVNPGDCVLLSPAGSSYDLYQNYEERGNHFKTLVMKYIQNHQS